MTSEDKMRNKYVKDIRYRNCFNNTQNEREYIVMALGLRREGTEADHKKNW